MATIINTELVEELNDLVQIQNDRIAGYENAIKDVQEKNTDLQEVFERMRDTSLEHRSQLANEISLLGGTTEEGTTISGKIYRAWMDTKDALTGSNRERILESCKYGEEAAQKAYDMALESEVSMSMSLRQLLIEQQKELKMHLFEITRLEEMADRMD